MTDQKPAREALKGMEVAIPPGHGLPPQQSPDPYAQRPLPPIPPKSPARRPLVASNLSHLQDMPPTAPPRSPSRAYSTRSHTPPPEFWKLSRRGPACSNKPVPVPIMTSSRATDDHGMHGLPTPDPPFMRKKSWSVAGTRADTDVISNSGTARSPGLAPTLHNSPDKIRQMIGHDVNINFNPRHSRGQSEKHDSAAYTVPPSPTSSSCYSNETLETTLSEPAPAPMGEGGQATFYDEDPERTLVAEGFNFNPSPPKDDFEMSRTSAHVDPLIIRRRAEVVSGEIKLHPAIRGSRRQSDPHACQHCTDQRRKSTGSADSRRTEREEDYVVKDLYHATAAHIAASSKRHETLEFPRPPPSPSRPTTPWSPIARTISLLSPSHRSSTSQRRSSRLGSLPFSASALEVGDQQPTSAFDLDDDEHRSYMARVFRRSSSVEGRGAAERTGIQDLVAHARRGAGLLSRTERRRATLRHKIRVIPEGELE